MTVLTGPRWKTSTNSVVTSGRVAVFDEFPSAYTDPIAVGGETTLQASVSSWLSRHDDVPFDNYTDLSENRDDDQRRADALLWFEHEGVERDESGVLDDSKPTLRSPRTRFWRARTSGTAGSGRRSPATPAPESPGTGGRAASRRFDPRVDVRERGCRSRRHTDETDVAAGPRRATHPPTSAHR